MLPVLRASNICIILTGICERYAPGVYTDGIAIARQQQVRSNIGRGIIHLRADRWGDFEKFNRGDEIMTTRRRVRGESRYRNGRDATWLFFPPSKEREKERDVTLRVSQILLHTVRIMSAYASSTDVFTFSLGYLIRRSLFYWSFVIVN